MAPAGSRFLITVLTGDKHGAGTDCDVSIILLGAHGKTQEIKLDDTRNNFEANQVRTAMIRARQMVLASTRAAHLRWLHVGRMLLCHEISCIFSMMAPLYCKIEAEMA